MTKPSNINNIPAEIWENIFNKLPNCTQRECQFVCKRWYLSAQRSFLEHIVLISCYDVQEFISCFMMYGTPASFESVKTIRIGSTYTPPDRARKLLESDAIQTIINHFPNVIELVISGNCIELEYFLKQQVIEAMLKQWVNLQIFRVDSGWLHPDKRKIYLQTNYNLRQGINQLILYEHNDVTQSMGGLKAYLMSFPKLKNIKVVSREICNLESCLPVIEHCQMLECLDVYVTREDIGCIMDRFLLGGGDKEIFEFKLKCLKSLKITMANFCSFTIEFIIQYMVGLENIIIGVNRINIEEWNNIQKNIFSNELLNFLCERKKFSFRSIQINYNEENEYMNNILKKLYHQLPLPLHQGKINRHIELIINNNSPDSGLDYNNMFSNIRNFVFEMGSEIDQNNTLIRTASFTHFIQHEGSLRNKSLKYLGHLNDILDDITSLTFNTFGMCLLIHVVPKIFQDTIQQFKNLKKVSIHLSKNYLKNNSFIKRDVTTIHENIKYLEIIAGNALCIEEDMLPLTSIVFPSLKFLSLWFNSGWFNNNNNNNKFIIEMKETNLERLHLDVTPIRVQMDKLKLNNQFFILKLTVQDSVNYYRVSIDYLKVDQLDNIYEDEGYLTIHLLFNSILYINLYLYRKYTDQFRFVSVLDFKDLIQTIICV